MAARYVGNKVRKHPQNIRVLAPSPSHLPYIINPYIISRKTKKIKAF